MKNNSEYKIKYINILGTYIKTYLLYKYDVYIKYTYFYVDEVTISLSIVYDFTDFKF